MKLITTVPLNKYGFRKWTPKENFASHVVCHLGRIQDSERNWKGITVPIKRIKHCPECRQGCISEIQINHYFCKACKFEAKIIILTKE